jgi:hypothetical protein
MELGSRPREAGQLQQDHRDRPGKRSWGRGADKVVAMLWSSLTLLSGTCLAKQLRVSGHVTRTQQASLSLPRYRA